MAPSFSKVRPLLEAEGSRTLEGMQQFAAEYDALEGSVRQLAMDCRAEAIRTQYDALRAWVPFATPGRDHVN